MRRSSSRPMGPAAHLALYDERLNDVLGVFRMELQDGIVQPLLLLLFLWRWRLRWPCPRHCQHTKVGRESMNGTSSSMMDHHHNGPNGAENQTKCPGVTVHRRRIVWVLGCNSDLTTDHLHRLWSHHFRTLMLPCFQMLQMEVRRLHCIQRFVRMNQLLVWQ